jgi:hypothetical protein
MDIRQLIIPNTYDNEYIPPAGTPRANATLNDAYVNIGVNINYKIWGKCQGEKGISKKIVHSEHTNKKRCKTRKYRKK